MKHLTVISQMSDYNALERTVGAALTRFPQIKSTVETVYQRTAYRFFGDPDFEYELHRSASIRPVAAWGHVDRTRSQFVGFYDVCPWNATMQAYVVHEYPGGADEADIVVIRDGSASSVGQTEAWNYQQGSRLQWHPVRETELVFNDVIDRSLVTRVLDVEEGEDRMIDHPVQAVNPNGGAFLSIDYRRLQRNSPGYGYNTVEPAVLSDPQADGITRVGFDGSTELLVSLAELRSLAESGVPHSHHYLHHLRYSPDGEHFAFLHRWIDGTRRRTQLFVSDRSGRLSLHIEDQYLSHFCWLDEERLFLYGSISTDGRGYYILDISTGSARYVSDLDGFGDGHPSLSPDGRWIVTDTYPNRLRRRTLWLYDLETGNRILLGQFHAPFQFDGVMRCDLHPRWSPDGQLVSIDSAHSGERGSYIIDVSSITGRPTSSSSV